MKTRLVAMMANVIKRQDRTWGVKRVIINNQYYRVVKLCDQLNISWREVLRAAESEVYA